MRIVDEVHNEIIIEDRDLQDLVHTYAFRRLKGLKQQGNTFYLLPGAVHTRYSHSLGVYANAVKIADRLEASGTILLSHYERKLIQLTALLHDIGHGPYSHCFEAITGINHKEWTAKIIIEDDEIGEILNRTPGIKEDVIHVLGKKGRFPILENIFFSPLGADSLDYLERDLLHSGLEIVPFDANIIIQNLEWRDNTFTVNYDACQEIERLLIVKNQLHEFGFGHPFTIGKDLLLKLVFKRASFLYQNGCLHNVPQPVIPVLKGSCMLQVSEVLELSDRTIYETVCEWAKEKDAALSALSLTYISPNLNLNWTEVDRKTYELLNQQLKHSDFSFESELFAPNPKYAFYTGGIRISMNERIFDVTQLSARIREQAESPDKFYLYFANENPLLYLQM